MECNSAVVLSFACLASLLPLSSGAGILSLGAGRTGPLGGPLGLPPIMNGPGGLGGSRGGQAAVLQGLGPRDSPLRPKPLAILQPGIMTGLPCAENCKDDQCCLLKPNTQMPSCQPIIYEATKKCSWFHCYNSTTMPGRRGEAVYGDYCPCVSGMCCLGSGQGKDWRGTCSFL